MNSLQYDTAEMLARFTAPSTLADEVIRLRARVKQLEGDYAALEYLDHEASIGAGEVARQLKELETKNARLNKLYRAVKSSGLRHNYLLKPIMDEIEQQPTT